MEEILRFRYNAKKVSTLYEFANIKGGINGNCKDVYFVRILGVNPDYSSDIQKMEELLLPQRRDGKKSFYKRLDTLPKLILPEDISFYSKCYSKWIDSGKTEVSAKASLENYRLRLVLGSACAKIEKLYETGNKQANSSMLRNLVVKLLYWFDFVFVNEDFVWNENTSIKIALSNVQKSHEYLFAYLLTLAGCDILLLQCRCDISEKDDNMGLSEKFILGNFSDIKLPDFNDSYPKVTATDGNANQQTEGGRVQVHIPKRERKHPQQVRADNTIHTGRTEKSFEELAQLASSVVMIGIRDKTGKVRGSGSGIMIGEKGYILTNHHVACEGISFLVRIEEDENEYLTNEIIKYNPMLDLAVIRIQRRLNPLRIYNGEQKLVRGQRVVAIGSPLGLFNSVSDGIISGFRKIQDVDMIQFTAPISHGSSGGALLNMQGEVIGISTAGIEDGQNLNLAVGYESIRAFVRGFVSQK